MAEAKRAARTNREMMPAIILSGHTMALGVVRALAAMAVPVYVVYYEPQHIAQSSRYVMKSYRAPHPENEPAAFINLLMDKVANIGTAVLFPVSDETVVAVAKHKAELSRHYVVACPSWDIAQKFIDKATTYRLAQNCGVAVPKTILPETSSRVEDYAAELGYPCLVKPKHSHLFYARFRKKMFVARNARELVSAYSQAEEAGLDVVLQQIVPGPDTQVVNYNSYVVEGRAVAEFTAEHIRNGPPGFGSPRVALSKAIPGVIEPGRRLLHAMGFAGYACTEFKMDPRDGSYKLMEVNGRHNLSTLLAVHCGMNFPYIEYLHRAYGDMMAANDFNQDIYWIDILRDIGFSILYRKQERYGLWQYAEPYRKPHVYAIFDRKDPAPFLRRSLFLASAGLRRLVGGPGAG